MKGAKMGDKAPFDFDYLVKEGEDVESLHEMAVEYHVRYIVIDETYMKYKQGSYDKFLESSLLQPLEDVNVGLEHASVYEVIGVDEQELTQNEYFYWDIWRVLGAVISMLAFSFFLMLCYRIDLKVLPD